MVAMPILILLAAGAVSIVLALVPKLITGLRDLVREPIRTVAKVIQYLAALAMLGAIAFAVYCQWFNGPQMSSGSWWLFAFSIIAAIAVIGVAQTLIDRPSRRERRIQQHLMATMRNPTTGNDDPARYREARRIWEQQQRYAAGDRRSQQQIVDDLQDNINRVEALMRAANEAEAEVKRRQRLDQ